MRSHKAAPETPGESAHLHQLLRRQPKTQVLPLEQLLSSAIQILCNDQVTVLLFLVFSGAEPVVQLNTWVGSDSSHMSLPVVPGPRLRDDHIYLEEVKTDEDKLSCSVLSSDSMFLPFTSDLDPQVTHSESEDETETFEPDSLAPKWPSHPANNLKKICSPPLDVEETTLEEEVASSAAVTAVEVGESRLQNDPEPSPDVGKAEPETPVEDKPSPGRSDEMEAHEAAVKIQSWWRGQHTRSRHPEAREVRGEIRLRRMQEHIVHLSGKLDR